MNNKITNFTGDLSATSALGIIASKTGVAATDAGNLVDSLGDRFSCTARCRPQMRTAIVNHVATLTNIGATGARGHLPGDYVVAVQDRELN